MYQLSVKTHFDAAHWLEEYEGKCNRLHGHRWEVEVVLTGEELDERNMLVDFGDVKAELGKILNSRLDHYCLNKTLEIDNPTAEYLAKWLYEALTLPAHMAEVDITSVKVWESPECCVEYYE